MFKKIIFLLLVSKQNITAITLDFRGNFQEKSNFDIFKFLVFETPFKIDTLIKNLANNEKIIVLINNPLNENINILSDEAFLKEGKRILLAFLCSYKRMFPDIRLQIILTDDNNIFHEIIFAPNVSLGLQGYHLEEKIDESLNKLEQKNNRRITVIVPDVFNISKPRVLITGCAGFLGSSLTKLLLKKGLQVIGVDNCVSGQLSNLIDVKDNQDFYYIAHDISIPFKINGRLDFILHFASIPSPVMYYKMPFETLNAGLRGTLNTLDLAVEKNARYLFASTSEIYGNPEVNPQPETYAGRVDPLGIRAQYDESKRGGETLINLYFKKFGLDARIVRIFNTYGPGMRLNDGRVVNSFLESLLHDKPITIYGNGEQSRSFAYVTDTIEGIIKLLDNNELSKSNSMQERVFNIGNPAECTINELAYTVQKLGTELLNKNVPIKHVPRFDTTDPDLRRPDITKARNILNFEPKVSLEEGLKRTLVYFIKGKS